MAKKVVIDFEARLAKFEQGIQRANAKLDAFSNNAKGRAAQLQSVFTSLGVRLGGAFAIGATVAKIGGGVSDISREMGRLKATLKILTGSGDEANHVMQRLEEFTAGLPISITEATQAFVRMKSLGLDPTEDALRSFGNTSSAMGKSLDQFVEAVADAVTGEFERLKEFGIKASQQGDKVAFTFQGITTTVKKNAQDIQRYLEGIGNTTFAGAMEEQAQTWDGAMRRMSNSWDGFLLAVSRTGAIDQATKLIGESANLVNGLARGIRLVSDDASAAEQAAEITREIERLEKAQAGLFAKANAEPGFFDRLFGDTEGQLERVTRRLNELREIRQTLLFKAQPKDNAGDGKIDTGESVSALDRLRSALDAANNSASKYNETVKLLKEKKADPLEKATSAASKVAKTYQLLGDALSAVRSGDKDAASDIEAAATAVNRLQENGLLAAQTIKDMKQALAGAIAPPKEAEAKLVIKAEIDEKGLVAYTDEATKKAQEAAKANPIIIPIKPEVIDGSGSRFLEQIPEFAGGFDIEAEKYGTKR